MIRVARAAALALVSMLTLAGCFKYDVDLTVHSDNTVSGTEIVAIQKGTGEQLGVGSDEEALKQMFDGQTFGQGATPTDYAEDNWVGKKYKFDGIALDKLSDFDKLFTLTRDGDTFTLKGTEAPTSEEDAAGAPDGAESKFSITFPGKVTAANGTIDGNTVTWDLLKQTEPLTATAKASNDGANLSVVFILLGAGLLVALVVAATVITVRARKASKAADALPDDDAPAAGSDSLPTPEVEASAEGAAPVAEDVATEDKPKED